MNIRAAAMLTAEKEMGIRGNRTYDGCFYLAGMSDLP